MVKVAIVDSNEIYLKRLQNYWSKTYGSKAVIVYTFAEYEQFMEYLKKERIDILLINNQQEADMGMLPDRLLKVYLLPGKKRGEIKGIPALPKNGNADELYKKLMELYEEHLEIEHVTIPGQMIFFTSPAGGCGASSCAVGCGKHLASYGKKVLYLNLENISAMELMLDGEPKQGMEELFYLCRTNRKNLSFSMEHIAGTDSSGLKYIAQCKNPMELKEMTVEELKNMLTLVTEKGTFDYVIVDRGFSMEPVMDELMELATHVVLVSDGTVEGQKKLEYLKMLLEEESQRGLLNKHKIKILYNKGNKAADDSIGSLPMWSGMTPRQVTDQIGHSTVFDALLVQDE